MLAEVRPHPLFSEGAVLQRGQVVPVWGTADEGEKITVAIQGKKAAGVCRDGRWRVELPALEAGGPFEMTIAGKNTITLKKVWIGEVWVCSGQSNMDLTVADCDRAEEEIAGSANAQIRLCKVPRQAADEPQATIPLAWQECSPRTVGNMSGVGYFFARDLQAALKVPVGLIDAAYGGTPAEAWMSPEALKSRPEFQPILDEYAEQVQDSPRAMAQYQADLAAWELAAAEAKQAGGTPPPRPQIPMGPFNFRRPSGLYRGMILPLAPYAMRGVIWYQGERNSPRAKQYRTLFPALIADWRKTLAARRLSLSSSCNWLRSARRPANRARACGPSCAKRNCSPARPCRAPPWRSSPTWAMRRTSIRNASNPWARGWRWPRAPSPMARRSPIAGRLIAAHEVRGDRIVISFTDVGQGLVCRGDRLEGFAICGADRKFVNADAEIVGDHVEVHSPQIPQPVAVRFGWADVPGRESLEQGRSARVAVPHRRSPDELTQNQTHEPPTNNLHLALAAA